MSSNNHQYGTLLSDVSEQILRSRYKAAKLVNTELLALYLSVGKRLSEKTASEQWGTSILERLAEDSQKQVPGLRGFPYRNLRNMAQFSEAYYSVIYKANDSNEGLRNEERHHVFFSLGFLHHILLLNRCSELPERLF